MVVVDVVVSLAVLLAVVVAVAAVRGRAFWAALASPMHVSRAGGGQTSNGQSAMGNVCTCGQLACATATHWKRLYKQ